MEIGFHNGEYSTLEYLKLQDERPHNVYPEYARNDKKGFIFGAARLCENLGVYKVAVNRAKTNSAIVPRECG